MIRNFYVSAIGSMTQYVYWGVTHRLVRWRLAFTTPDCIIVRSESFFFIALRNTAACHIEFDVFDVRITSSTTNVGISGISTFVIHLKHLKCSPSVSQKYHFIHWFAWRRAHSVANIACIYLYMYYIVIDCKYSPIYCVVFGRCQIYSKRTLYLTLRGPIVRECCRIRIIINLSRHLYTFYASAMDKMLRHICRGYCVSCSPLSDEMCVCVKNFSSCFHLIHGFLLFHFGFSFS